MKQETLEEYIKEVTKNFGDKMSVKFTSGGIKLGASIKYMPALIKKVNDTTCIVHVLCKGSYTVSKEYIY
jgi:hypothetical protein